MLYHCSLHNIHTSISFYRDWGRDTEQRTSGALGPAPTTFKYPLLRKLSYCQCGVAHVTPSTQPDTNSVFDTFTYSCLFSSDHGVPHCVLLVLHKIKQSPTEETYHSVLLAMEERRTRLLPQPCATT